MPALHDLPLFTTYTHSIYETNPICKYLCHPQLVFFMDSLQIGTNLAKVKREAVLCFAIGWGSISS